MLHQGIVYYLSQVKVKVYKWYINSLEAVGFIISGSGLMCHGVEAFNWNSIALLCVKHSNIYLLKGLQISD